MLSATPVSKRTIEIKGSLIGAENMFAALGYESYSHYHSDEKGLVTHFTHMGKGNEEITLKQSIQL